MLWRLAAFFGSAAALLRTHKYKPQSSLTSAHDALSDVPVVKAVPDKNDWETKYRVLTPIALDNKKEEYTRFDKYKSKYMGRYNSVDQSKTDMNYADFGALVAAQEYSFKNGDILTGTVVQYDGPQKAMVEVGAKTAAVLPLREATISPLSDGETISDFVDVGEQYEFQIVSDSRDDGQVTVSIKKIMYAQAWEKLAMQYAEDPVFEAEIVQVNRGGAIVLVEGLRAFLPGSHIMGTGGASDAMVGKKISLKFLEVNQEANKLVVSNRRAVIEHSMASIKRGEVYDGTVTAVKPYGAFVEIMGMSGLLHISQISYDRVENLEATLTAGLVIKCMVIDHDKAAGRIALSTKTLEPEPGDMLRDPGRVARAVQIVEQQLLRSIIYIQVFALAHETAAKYHVNLTRSGAIQALRLQARVEAERIAREHAASEMVLSLGEELGPLEANDAVSLNE